MARVFREGWGGGGEGRVRRREWAKGVMLQYLLDWTSRRVRMHDCTAVVSASARHILSLLLMRCTVLT